MNALDLLLVVLAVSAGVAGWQLGFVARASSWTGLVVGLAVGALSVPPVLRAFEGGSPVVLLVLTGGVLVATTVALQAVGMAIGSRLRRSVPDGAARTTDQVAGAALGVVGVFVALWLLLPLLSDVEGGMANVRRTSAVVDVLDELAPPPPDGIRSFQEAIAAAPFPEVFTQPDTAPAPGPPPAGVAVSPAVADAVARSTVKVESEGCGRRHEGSGFVGEAGLVVTNAHVVAGADTVRVVRADGRRVRGEVVGFDDDRDLALVRAGVDAPPLPRAEASAGEAGTVFGHPGGQEALRLAPASVSRRVLAAGRDIYGSDEVRRDVLVLAAQLHPGDSGGAVVDPEGRVVGVAFAIARDQPGVAYALSTKELDAVLSAPHDAPVPTGVCV